MSSHLRSGLRFRGCRPSTFRQHNFARQTLRNQSGQATTAPSSSLTSHALAGIAGGGVVALIGYSYYHFSGTKKVIDNVVSVRDSVAKTASNLKDKAPAPNEILKYLRSTAKSYAVFVPGAAGYIDSTFDSLDELASTHNEELEKILKGAYDEVYPVVQSGKMDQETAQKLYEILRRRSSQLQELAGKAGSDFFGTFLEKHPDLKKKVGSGYEELQKIASTVGPEAKDAMNTFSKKVQEIVSNGLDDKTISRVQDAIQETSKKLKSAAEKGGNEAWEKAKKQAEPFLNKFPQIQSLLNEKAAVLMGSGAGAKEIWKKVKELSEQKGVSKEKVEELGQFITDKANDAENSAGNVWETVQGFASQIPGAEELMKNQPDLEQLLKVLREDSGEAKKLAEETLSDVVSLLQEKAKKAKKLGENVKEDVKDTQKGDGKKEKQKS